MAAANVDYAILSSYRHTIFFIRDPHHPTIIYNSSVYDNRFPILLYYATFLALAACPDRFPKHIPEIPEIDAELAEARRSIRQHEENRSKKYGALI